MMKRILFGLLAVLMLFTAACGANSGTETTEPSVENGGSFYLSDDDTFQVVTPYCVLKYPVKWETSVVTEVSETEDLYSVSYNAKLSGVQIPLFTIILGESSEGFVLGTLDTGDAVVSVQMIDHSGEFEGTLSEEDEAKFLEMCEDVNVIITSLVNESGMLTP